MVCSCGQKIPVARLKAVPGTTSCVRCQGEDESALAAEEERSRRRYNVSVSKALFEQHGTCAVADEPTDDDVDDPDEYAHLDEVEQAWFENVEEPIAL